MRSQVADQAVGRFPGVVLKKDVRVDGSPDPYEYEYRCLSDDARAAAGEGSKLSRKLVAFALCLASASLGAGFVSPAFAQRYPPFPIGGGQPGGATTTPPPASGSGSEFFNAGGSGADGGGSNAGTSSTDSDPACDIATCLHYAGQVGSAFVTAKVEELGTLRVGSFKGCCAAFARIDVFMESERVLLGTVFAKEDGSYFGEFTLPASIEPGRHHLVADIEGCGELKGAIEVVEAGASVLGTSTRNTSARSGVSANGVLPRTGSDVLRILLLALILIALGTLLIAAMRRFTVARAQTGRVRGRGAIAALPVPEVPFIDTSRFVPYHSSPRERPEDDGQGPRATRARPRTDGPSSSTTQRARTTSVWDRTSKNASPS